jgi:AcrR family transcriptional regulator
VSKNLGTKKLTRAEQKASRPLQILDAAFEEFVEKGYVATRVEDIAERIGVTKGTIYTYFPTKDELFTTMIRHISVAFEDVFAKAPELTGTCAERLAAIIRLFYECVLMERRTREMLRFVISEGSRFPQVVDGHYREVIEPIFTLTQALLDEGVRLGEFRQSPAIRANVVVAPVLSMMVETLIFDNRRDLDLSGYIDAHLDLVARGLSTRDT